MKKFKLLEQLKNAKVYIRFLDDDGNEQTIYCTTVWECLLPNKVPREMYGGKRMKQGETCKVFDLDKNEWISFKQESIIFIRYPSNRFTIYEYGYGNFDIYFTRGEIVDYVWKNNQFPLTSA